MDSIEDVRIIINPSITPSQLFSFYKDNDICEAGFGEAVAARVLKHSSIIVGAFKDEQLVGIARAMFDGIFADVLEFCLALEYQGEDLEYENGSLIESDPTGLGKKIGKVLIDELVRMGAYFISTYILGDCSETFYESIGFRHNKGHLVYVIDRRPYVSES